VTYSFPDNVLSRHTHRKCACVLLATPSTFPPPSSAPYTSAYVIFICLFLPLSLSYSTTMSPLSAPALPHHERGLGALFYSPAFLFVSSFFSCFSCYQLLLSIIHVPPHLPSLALSKATPKAPNNQKMHPEKTQKGHLTLPPSPLLLFLPPSILYHPWAAFSKLSSITHRPSLPPSLPIPQKGTCQ